MSQLEILNRDTWRDFLAAPSAVLMLGKSDCEACQAWTSELEAFLAEDSEWSAVRFGKLELDQPGLTDFKRENKWLAEIDDLPYNVVCSAGERKKQWIGAGVDRLVNRMRRVYQADES